jgi:hypothetical protein
MQTDQAKQKAVSGKTRGVINLIGGLFLFFMGITRLPFHPSHVFGIILGLRILEVVCGLLLSLSGLFVLLGPSLFGRISHEQVFDLNIEQRVRKRYAEEIRQLTFLGFNYSFLESESFSIFRLLMIFPAIVLFMMLLKREVLALGRGGRILVVMPVFGSADGLTFAHPFALGVKFYTAFRNGQLLITKDFKDDCRETPEFVVQAANGTISETWQTHQALLDRLNTDANPASRDRSYEAFVNMSERESDLLKSQIRSLG